MRLNISIIFDILIKDSPNYYYFVSVILDGVPNYSAYFF